MAFEKKKWLKASSETMCVQIPDVDSNQAGSHLIHSSLGHLSAKCSYLEHG